MKFECFFIEFAHICTLSHLIKILFKLN